MLLFTYGSLMRDGYNHDILTYLKAKFLNDASIEAIKVPTGYPFPAVKEGLGLVLGEVYEVNEAAMAYLDAFEQNPTFYQRRTTTTTDGQPVHVYFGTGVIGSRPQPLSQ